tara:strand:- start:45193 stop:47271 length:2079 start_codon:yes stop_codon:yes gene_type:complete
VPRIHSPGHGEEKKVGWLELFYDLIYVATFIQLGNALSHNLSIQGTLAFAGILVPLWLTWTAFTFYANRFEVDDLTHRALVFIQMFAIGGLAVSVGDVFGGDTTRFALVYTVARLVLVLLYARTYWQQKKARDMTSRYLLGFGVGVMLWGVSVFLPSPWVYVCWGVAVAIDLGLPLGRENRSLSGRYPLDAMHLSERYGLLTLIVLGESFVKVLTSISDVGATPTHLLTGGLGLTVVCSLWWIYFDDVAGSRIKGGDLSAICWLYSHLPLTIAIVGTGVSIKGVVFFDLTEVAPPGYRWLLCSSLAVAFFSVAAIDAVTERRQSEFGDRFRTTTRFASALFVLLLAGAGASIPAWAFAGLVALCCLAQVLLDLMMAPLAADHEMLHEGMQDAYGVARAHDEEEDEDDVIGPPKRHAMTAAIRKGTPSELRRDLYFHFMDSSWWLLFGAMLCAFFLVNGIFAALYLLEPNSVVGAEPGSLLDAFAFSVQTMTTIGYGSLSPATEYAHMLVTAEVIIGIFGAAVSTGLMFAKASRPQTSTLFSNPVVVTNFHGKPTLMFRVGNARGNEIVEASISVSALVEETSPEGITLSRLHDIKLERATTPLFVLTWQVLHVLDETSPLFGLSKETLEQTLSFLIVSMTGHDGTYGQTVHGRTMYYHEDFRFNHRFVDVISTLEDGRLMVDYDKFHKTVAE